MLYKKSHNDSIWVTPQVTKAIDNGCNVFEADVILLRGSVMCRHSWRPFKFMCKGTLQQYLDKLIKYVDYPIVLQVEIKDPDVDIINKVSDIINEYDAKFKYPIIFAMFGSVVLDRHAFAEAIKRKVNKSNVIMWKDWETEFKNDLEIVDLFGEKHWWWY